MKTFQIFSSVTTLPSVVFPPLSHGHLRWVCAFHKILTLLAILCLFGFTHFSCNHGKKYSVGLYLQIVKPWPWALMKLGLNSILSWACPYFNLGSMLLCTTNDKFLSYYVPICLIVICNLLFTKLKVEALISIDMDFGDGACNLLILVACCNCFWKCQEWQYFNWCPTKLDNRYWCTRKGHTYNIDFITWKWQGTTYCICYYSSTFPWFIRVK